MLAGIKQISQRMLGQGNGPLASRVGVPGDIQGGDLFVCMTELHEAKRRLLPFEESLHNPITINL